MLDARAQHVNRSRGACVARRLALGLRATPLRVRAPVGEVTARRRPPGGRDRRPGRGRARTGCGPPKRSPIARRVRYMATWRADATRAVRAAERNSSRGCVRDGWRARTRSGSVMHPRDAQVTVRVPADRQPSVMHPRDAQVTARVPAHRQPSHEHLPRIITPNSAGFAPSGVGRGGGERSQRPRRVATRGDAASVGLPTQAMPSRTGPATAA